MDKNGRKPIVLMSKNLTKAEIARREEEEKLSFTDKDQLRTPPDWLMNDRAVKEWNRITGELLELDIIGNLDIDALAGYCNALAEYIETVDALKDAPLLIDMEMANGATRKVANPLFEIQRKHADEMRKFGRLCGITLDSRLKAASLRVDKEEDAIEKEFGVI